MKIEFSKYQGTGNDFVIIDNRNETLEKDNQNLYQFLCDRRFGIGADGVILLQQHNQYAFEMVYFNANGKESSMCGNGGRCITHFAKSLGIINNETTFYAIDGEHEASIKNDDIVTLKMLVYENIDEYENGFVAETGSPHFIQFLDDIDNLNIIEAAHTIRYNNTFKEKGINVNFVNKRIKDNLIHMRTYERGVEDETLSCGTGTVAVAMVARTYFKELKNSPIVNIQTKGGNLKVHFKNNGVWLEGKVSFVFKGLIEVANTIA